MGIRGLTTPSVARTRRDSANRGVARRACGALSAVAVAIAAVSAIAAPPVLLLDPLNDPSGSAGSSLHMTASRVYVGAPTRRIAIPGGPSSNGAVLRWQRGIDGSPIGAPEILTAPAAKRGERFGAALTTAPPEGTDGVERLFAGAWSYSLSVSTITNPRGRVAILPPVPPGEGDSEDAQHQYMLAPPSDMPVGSEFGAAISLLGNHLAVGAPGWVAADTDDFGVGSVRVFDSDGGIWFAAATLALPNTPSTPHNGARFGSALAMNESTITVGAPNAVASSADLGGAGYLFSVADLTAAPVEISSPQSEIGDHFGAALAMNETWLAVGAPGAACGAGRVYVFALNGIRPTFEAELAPTDAAARGFGSSVALDRSRIAIGTGAANGDDTPINRAYVFRRTIVGRDRSRSASWTLEREISDARFGEGSCGCVAIDPAGVLVAAVQIEDPVAGGAASGAAYVPTERSADLDFDGRVGASDVGILLQGWGPANGITPEDLNGDGIVDAHDLSILLGGWQ